MPIGEKGTKKKYEQLEMEDLQTNEEKEPEKLMSDHGIHFIQRVLSTGLTPKKDGSVTVFELDAYIKESFVDAGWTVQSVHYLGQIPEGYNILIVVVK